MASTISPASTAVGPTRAALLPVTGRVLMSALFLVSGAGKLAAPGATIAAIQAAGLPLPPLSYGAATLVEVGGGLLQVAAFGAGPFSLDARQGRT